jgi:sarcosine oxidase, subunit gamma
VRRDPTIAACVKLGEVTLTPLPEMTRLVFRGGLQAQAACDRGLGLDLPRTALKAAHRDQKIVLWQGPDEWLIILPQSDRIERLRSLREALEGLPHSLVEVSHRNVGMVLRGGDVEKLLNAGCPLDLSPAAFPVGMTSRTIFAKADITLWRLEVETFHVEVGRSFTPYLIGVLHESVRGL